MNEAMAQFIGLEKDRHLFNYDNGRSRTVYLKDGHWLPIRKLKYNSSWDWLMPVWKRLIDAVAGQTEEGDYPADFSSIMDMYACHCEQVDIASAHDIVYKAIQWYNKNTNNAITTKAI